MVFLGESSFNRSAVRASSRVSYTSLSAVCVPRVPLQADDRNSLVGKGLAFQSVSARLAEQVQSVVVAAMGDQLEAHRTSMTTAAAQYEVAECKAAQGHRAHSIDMGSLSLIHI